MRRYLRLCLGFLAVISIAPACAAEVTAAPSPSQRVETFATYWTGFFSNERQARLNGDRLMPAYPELVRLNRDHRVHWLKDSPLGEFVLFMEEIKADTPTVAHRQRVMTLSWLPKTEEIKVTQLFFTSGPTYDRPLLDPKDVERLSLEDFTLYPGCDLYFSWDDDHGRFKGGMRPQTCQYDHPESGPVYAEFDMVLDEDRMMYRDRSIKLSDGTIRGEIDGFSWLIYARLAETPTLANGDRISKKQLMRRMPAAGSMEGAWEGRFTRIDVDGNILEQFPTRITSTYLPDGHEYDFHQVNVYRPGTPQETRIESYGKWDVDRLRFFNNRLEGWSKDVELDPTGLTSAFVMSFKDGSGLAVSEIISRSPADPDQRMRATQYMKNGTIIRRTMIEETRVR